MKIAYLLGTRTRYVGKATKTWYTFTPWDEVDERDWPKMESRKVWRGGCCGSASRQLRVFGSEEEVRTGQVETHWR